MLEPHERSLLMDALRPPEGYSLDFAVGTTFSLDLVALMTAPLGFTRFELQDSDGSDIGETDAHLLLRTIREFAGRITIFGQAGRIAVPRVQRPLLSMLEEMVVEVVPPTPNRVFHPKVWALRFDASDAPVLYRLLVLSRNLTFARCWDTLLVLDGELLDRANGIGANRPLGDFFAALPGMAIRGVQSRVRERVEQLQRELRKVRFELPPGFEQLLFHPLGVPDVRTQPMNVRTDRLLIISPFLSSGQLAELALPGRRDVLVSRLDSLQKLSADQLAPFAEIFALDPAAAIDPERAVEQLDDPFNEGAGLHAKVFVADDGWNAHVWTGSANATSAAFTGNVEFLVELIGKKGLSGVEALLKRQDGITMFRDVLREYTPESNALLDDAASEALDQLLDENRTAIATQPWTATVNQLGDTGQFDLSIESPGAAAAAARVTRLAVYPITLQPSVAISITDADAVAFREVAPETITSFFAFELTAEHEQLKRTCRFVVNAQLVGAPANRRELLLRSMLKDRRQVIRFLLMLLGDIEGGPAENDIRLAMDTSRRGSVFESASDEALLEPLLRALDRDPARLDQVDSVLRDLGVSDSSRLPEGLREIFGPIWEARQTVAK